MSLQEISSQITLQLFPTQLTHPSGKHAGNRVLGYNWIWLVPPNQWNNLEVYPAWLAVGAPYNITWNTDGGPLANVTPHLTLSGNPPVQISNQAGTAVSGGPQYTWGNWGGVDGLYRFTASVAVGSETFVGDPEMAVGSGGNLLPVSDP